MKRLLVCTLTLVFAGSFGCRSNDKANPPSGQNDAAVTQSDAAVDASSGDAATDASYDNIKALRAAPPANGTVVSIASAVVIGVKGSYTEIWIEDADGGPKSGLNLYCPDSGKTPCVVPQDTIKGLRNGMKVAVTGTYEPYKKKIEIRPTSLQVIDNTLGPLPPAVDLSLSDVIMDKLTSDYQGVLVNITSVTPSTPLVVVDANPTTFSIAIPDGGVPCTTGVGPRWSAFVVSDVPDGTGELKVAVETTFYRQIDLQIDPLCVQIDDGGPSGKLVVNGDKFTKLGGVMDLDTYVGKMVIMPSADDGSQYVYAADGDHDGGI
jgi:hypothetical protein